jgi:hypothetical protein
MRFEILLTQAQNCWRFYLLHFVEIPFVDFSIKMDSLIFYYYILEVFISFVKKFIKMAEEFKMNARQNFICNSVNFNAYE